LGDWFDLGPNRPGVSQLTAKGITATATYYYDATIMKQIALLLNRTEDAEKFQTLSTEIKQAFNKNSLTQQPNNT